MGYEFDCTSFDVVINDVGKFFELKQKISEVEGRSFFGEDIEINHSLYDYDASYYGEDIRPLKLKHGCCYKLHNLHQIFKIIAEYCTGEMEFKCEYGELLEVEISNGAYSFEVYLYKSVPITEVPELEKKFNFPKEEGL